MDQTTRQQLCEQLYLAGMKRDAAEIGRLQKQINDIDQELEVPDFEPPTDVPKVGDLIYLPTRGSIGHGFDDVRGGVGTVKAVREDISGGKPAFFVTAHEQPGRGHNWEFLSADQAENKQYYGDGWARPDPDLGIY